ASRRSVSVALRGDGGSEVVAGRRSVVVANSSGRGFLMSPWRGGRSTKEESEAEVVEPTRASSAMESQWTAAAGYEVRSEKKGIWNWKPFRVLTHMSMQKLSCLFTIEVVGIHNLPPAMNGLRLCVCVRKKETKDGAVQTMPSKVCNGVADFEERLFLRCHVYFTPGNGISMKFEPRQFLVYVVAGELDFGRSSVDLSALIQESIEKSFEGIRIKQFDRVFTLAGKARGGELVLKLGFQIMDKNGGITVHNDGVKFPVKTCRKMGRQSFSVSSPMLSAGSETWTPRRVAVSEMNHLHGCLTATPPPQSSLVSDEGL
ncbi:hypothetical protein M569_01464, partial [Genlisea aurea]